MTKPTNYRNRILTGILLSALFLGGVACQDKKEARKMPELSCTAPYHTEAGYGTYIETLCHVTDDRLQMRVNCDDAGIWCDDEGA